MNQKEEINISQKSGIKKKKSNVNLSNDNSGLYVDENCIINAVCDYGFTYDVEDKKYYNQDKSICIDEKTRLVYVLKECYDLKAIYLMQASNILKVL